MKLSSHANVFNSCLRLLQGEGWNLRVEGEVDDGGSYRPESLWWTAARDEVELGAHNPIELLGLARIYEYRGAQVKRQPPEDEGNSYWWVVEGRDLYTELIERAFPD